MKKNISLEHNIKILSEDLVEDNTLIQRIKDETEEKIRINWVEYRDREYVRCDYEIGPFQTVVETMDQETGTKTLYSNDSQIIEYNTKALARYRGPLCHMVDTMDLVEVFDFSNHHSIAPYDNLEAFYKEVFHKAPIEKKYNRK